MDNGYGIPVEDQQHIFDRFYRAHNEDVKNIEGSGLGLSIVHRIVEKLGGQVGVESESVPGLGSTFYFTLPEAAA